MRLGYGFGLGAIASPGVARTKNLLIDTRDFRTAAWTATGVTYVGTLASPLGGTAQNWAADGSSGIHAVSQDGFTFADDNVLSVYAMGGADWPRYFKLSLYDADLEEHHMVMWIMALDGTWSYESTTGIVGSYGVEQNVGEGFSRLWIYVDGSLISGNEMHAYIIINGDGSHTRDGNMDGAQLEQASGRTTPSAYVDGDSS